MKRITVSASKNYECIVEKGILSNFPYSPGSEKCFIITDSNVEKLYLKTVINRLSELGHTVITHVIQSGEASKNITVLSEILSALAINHISRTDCIFALGGGVVGDIAGFAASVYLRGIKYIQLPTTVLAAVDSSVGGKTAVNLPEGKNLVGAFYQPEAVFCDYSAFDTLSPAYFSDGCSEVIKYGMISDSDLFNTLAPGISDGINAHLEDIIARCIEIKSDIVNKDEHDTGIRQLLNFGHTIGHSVELSSKYTIPHGHAVAVGMAVITKAAVQLGFCDAACYERLKEILIKYNLPVSCNFSAEELYLAALSDKKHSGGLITLVLPKAVGHCILHKTTDSELYNIIKLGISD